jgi:hypothetical protein
MMLKAAARRPIVNIFVEGMPAAADQEVSGRDVNGRLDRTLTLYKDFDR